MIVRDETWDMEMTSFGRHAKLMTNINMLWGKPL